MTPSELAPVAENAQCKVFGWTEAENDGHRFVLAQLIRAFNNTESAVLCEPSLARQTDRPPDLVLIDAEIGVHTFEIKAMELDRIEGLEAGGSLRIRYANGVRARDPIAQVRRAMFDIKNATERSYEGIVSLPFKYWVVYPLIRRAAWKARFGDQAHCPPEYLFADDLDPRLLARRLGASDRQHAAHPIRLCPLEQLECVWRAFGDTSVLYATPEDRSARRTAEGTLGELFDEAAEAYKNLSAEQQRLSAMYWDGGPRLVRGVAGSGKTMVLANNLARRLERMLITASEDLFGTPRRPRLLAVCFNRSLAPFIEKKINIAFEQRTGRLVPEGLVDVFSFNRLMWHLANAGLWKYQSVQDVQDVVRAMQYRGELEQFRGRNVERMQELAYDAVYVDEGQDFLEEEFRLLKDLCRVDANGEPNLYVFYDDAQNLYGRSRPNWLSLGLNVRGSRAFVMNQCFRNTRAIVEAGFNMLYGSCAPSPEGLPTKEYGDLRALEQKNLIMHENGFWRVKFAPRVGAKPKATAARNPQHEAEQVVARLRWLIAEQEVRPQDILVLTFYAQRARQLAEAITAARIPGVAGVHVPLDDKDRALGQKGGLTVSTAASAKGYDAYCVLLASANDFPTDVMGRANFYVACTRAIEYLEVFSYEPIGLDLEWNAVLKQVSEG